jgi:hypothetical protein
MGRMKDMLIGEYELFAEDADTLTEEDFVAKHGEILHGEANTVQGAWKYTINAREWYKGYQHEKHGPDEPWFTA